MLPPDYREGLILRANPGIGPGTRPDSGPGLASDLARKAAPDTPPTADAATPEGQADSNAPTLENRFAITTTIDKCLMVYPWPDWLIQEDKFTRLSNPSAKIREFRRIFLGGAEIHTLDAQGRIRLSPAHRAYASLDKDISLVGLIDRFEIWNPAMLTAGQSAQNLDDVTNELAQSGIDFTL